MNREFFEFWGNLMLQVARGQKQMEDISRWMTQGFTSQKDLMDMFMKSFGIEPKAKQTSAGSDIWKEAMEQYREMMGLVSRAEYRALADRYEKMKRKSAEQEATIQNLRLQLAEQGKGQGELARSFQALMTDQQKQFEQLSESFQRFFSQTPSSSDTETTKK